MQFEWMHSGYDLYKLWFIRDISTSIVLIMFLSSAWSKNGMIINPGAFGNQLKLFYIN